MNPLETLTQLFKEFPGIGPRQAKRFVYFLLKQPSGYIDDITQLIKTVRAQMKQCTDCMRYFNLQHNKEILVCSICSDPKRDASKLIIIAKDTDLDAIEKSGAYTGTYFILGDLIQILEKNPAEKVYLHQLVKNIQKKSPALTEIIFALSTTVEGEHTEQIVREFIESLITEHSIKVSTLGRGLSTGLELEYTDSRTIQSALENKR